ncbi:hypothetical protein DERF_009443 [Dermatophagoides farinae]|uniref:Uncharacterized protein n=1 Tax=Dermatophagoides farinae TaxID=6954 RepID=A0A922L5Q1_DERFA|nr:hypothetical protein DERF_009443 [Dermatophagoides farinae]
MLTYPSNHQNCHFPRIPLNSAKIPEGNSHTKNIINTAINIRVVRSEFPDDDDVACNDGGCGVVPGKKHVQWKTFRYNWNLK